MKYKCAIFDLDGTLIDSLQGILDACNITFEQLGINIKKGYEESKDFIGAGATEFAKRALKGVKVSPELERKVMEVFLANYRKTQVTSAKPYPEITQMLLNLKKNGTCICIASNKPHMLLEEVVGHLFPDVKFDVALGQKPNTPEKPDPYIIYQILDKLHINPEDCIYVGDSEYDVHTAHNAGLKSVIVKYGYGFYDKPWIKKATYTVDSVNELGKLLN